MNHAQVMLTLAHRKGGMQGTDCTHCASSTNTPLCPCPALLCFQFVAYYFFYAPVDMETDLAQRIIAALRATFAPLADVPAMQQAHQLLSQHVLGPVMYVLQSIRA